MIARLLILSLLLLASCAPRQDRGPVVLAAASTQEAITDAANAWAAQGHPLPVLSFAGTPAIARQIEAGAPADIFISADEKWMARLDGKGLLKPGSVHTIAGNGLVAIVPGAPTPQTPGIERDSDTTTIAAALRGKRIATADTQSVPAGRYARAALESMGLWQSVAPHIIPAENVRAALVLVERGEVDAGIVYSSDAVASGKVRVVARFADNTHPPIRYPAAIVATSTHPDAAPFLDFLQSQRGQAAFLKYGFRTLAP